jgi:uncharacterized membrane-anchored protein
MNNTNQARVRAAVVSLALLLPLPALAQPTEDAQAEFAAAVQALNKARIDGPAQIKLVDQALLRLPAGFIYVPAAESNRLLMAMGNRGGDNTLGLLLPAAEDEGWFIVMRFTKSGYIKDDDARNWDVDELLKGLKEGTEEVNRERRSRGIPEVEVLAWVEAPKYDAASQRLVWSLESREKNAPADAPRGVNYNTYALGREGYISMNLVTGMSEIQAQKPVAHRALAALQYHEGKRYADFNSATDHVAEYGLAALVGGFAAKKLGLFAVIFAFLLKFWKIVALAVVGLGALVAKRLKGKVAASSSPQA